MAKEINKDIKLDDYLEEQLKDPEFKKYYEEENAKLKNAIAVMNVRKQAGLSQRQLADASHVPQSTIARIESGANTSIETLAKIAHALGKKVTVNFL